MDLLTPSIGLVFWSLVCFLGLFLVLRKYAWKPVLKAVKDREAHIDDSLLKANQAQKEFEELKAKTEQIIKEAYAEKEQIIKEANALRDKIVAESKEKAVEEGNKMIEKAKSQIISLQRESENAIKKEMQTIALEVARSVLKNEFSDPKVQEKYVKKEVDSFSLN